VALSLVVRSGHLNPIGEDARCGRKEGACELLHCHVSKCQASQLGAIPVLAPGRVARAAPGLLVAWVLGVDLDDLPGIELDFERPIRASDIDLDRTA
jgi:hypothetical protein